MSEKIDLALLARYQTLNALNAENLQEIHKQLTLENIPAGNYLFKKGDKKNIQYFLVKGEVDLIGDASVLRTIKGGTPEGFNALAHILPRTVSAKAKTDCIIFKIDGDLIDVMLTWDQTGSYQVTEFGVSNGNGDDDWMTRILQT
ncbi:MAG TPA: cyclic nucleotide-binding domain-containing protein, partial [Gammaproteobacteria bacterium]